MPIYKGNTPISNVYQGNSPISNVYLGTTPVFSSIVYPYKVQITGPLSNSLYHATDVEPIAAFPKAYFYVDNDVNAGATWYGIVLNDLAFNQMRFIAPHDGTISSMLKTAWYDFISIYIGYDINKTDMSSFTIASTFYALDVDEWNTSGDPSPKDPENTHCWKFISNGDYFDISYVILTQTDFAAIGTILLLGAQVVQFAMCPMSLYMSGQLNIDQAFLIVSKQITFSYNFNELLVEYVTNNGAAVGTSLVQSLTNNFNFSVRTMLLGVLSEVQRLGWRLTTDFGEDACTLMITNYTPPQFNVPGSLETQYVPFSTLSGGGN